MHAASGEYGGADRKESVSVGTKYLPGPDGRPLASFLAAMAIQCNPPLANANTVAALFSRIALNLVSHQVSAALFSGSYE